jgi:hypothetical protein
MSGSPSLLLVSGSSTGHAGLDAEADELLDAAYGPVLAALHRLDFAHNAAFGQLFVDEAKHVRNEHRGRR